MPRTLSTPQVRFVLHVAKGREKTFCPIYAIMQKGNERYKIATGEEARPSELDKAGIITRGANPVRRRELETLTKRLDWWRNFLRELWEEHHTPKMGSLPPQQIEPARFRELVKVRLGEAVETKTPDLLEFAAAYIEERARGKGELHSTVKTLRYGFNNLAAYSSKFGRLDYDSINFDWLEKFKAWLFQSVKYPNFKRKALNQNSAGQVVTAIKQFISEARKKGYTENQTVNERNFSVKKAPTNKVSFHISELEKLFKADLSKHPQTREMERVRLLTFVGIGTGCRFSDWGKIKKEFVEVHDGEELINVFAQKTKAKIGIPLLPILRQILEQHNWQLPKMATQRFNENVKELCKYVGLDRQVLIQESTGGKLTSKQVPLYEVVSSHACRRTFISTMLLLGVPASQLMPITGHSSEGQLRNYAQLEERQNAVNVSKSFRKGMVDFLGGDKENQP